MLELARELSLALNQSGQMRALLTRETDAFVSLERRMSIARAANADLLISLHADALEEDAVRGASIYTLSADGVDAAARRMAERHERGDLLAGLDLRGQGDDVATVLMDLVRAQTGPQSDRFADAAVETLTNAGVEMNSRPRRDGQFAVLNAPDFAAVLIETGFLSNPQDRARLATAEGRAPIVTGLADAVQLWAQEEAALAARLRQ
jgi:N-acetylmuramoyl-L-alanine amidase